MTDCNILDVGCNLKNLAGWLYSFLAPYLDPIINLITSLLNIILSVFNLIIGFISALATLGGATISNVFGFYNTIFATSPTALVIILLLQSYVAIVIFVRGWNILADIQIWGFKLPKIPL